MLFRSTYYWRIAATNSAGTSVGPTMSFITPIFERQTSISTSALLTALVIDRDNLTKAVVQPVAKSKGQCAINSRNNRLMLNKPGTCRVKVTLARSTTTQTAFFNLVVR